MSDPRFKIHDVIEYFDAEELIIGRIVDIQRRDGAVWYKIQTQLDEIDFALEEDLDLCNALS